MHAVLAHGGRISWDEILLVVAPLGLLLAVSLTAVKARPAGPGAGEGEDATGAAPERRTGPPPSRRSRGH